ncbi:polysaccharide deacetylase family protein [Arenibacter lacus]|uniref:polysaccharide deacetylase family protein n=1 Tax=Arenibacter lacus TaxID=2608629 RepID=UPI00123DF510|nr:polysaccharide deacetylase family protein [Arenibacter lacus]
MMLRLVALCKLIFLAAIIGHAQEPLAQNFTYVQGAVVRGDSTQKNISLVFTGDQFADGGHYLQKLLKKEKIPASFFFTGNFYRNPEFHRLIKKLVRDGHYLGAHSNEHLLYCDWTKRDSLLVTQEKFGSDLLGNYQEMKKFGIERKDAPYFLPPYEWYNDTIAQWTQELGFTLINMTHGTLTHADYTTPDSQNYRSSNTIYESITEYEEKNAHGLNGFLLLAHIGTDPKRTDKFYHYLPSLIYYLQNKGYQFTTVAQLLNTD